MKFSIDEYQKSVTEYKDKWRVLDDVLLRLCRDNPGHTTRREVYAKLWIIGRTYATGIERKVATKGTQGSSLSQVAEHFLAHGQKLDRLFDELRGITEPLTPAKLRIIVSVHGRIVTFLRPITRKRQSTRSFVSKYMHFHNPVVPIYDSIAAAKLPRIVPWKKELAVFDMPQDADENYGRHVMRFYRLYLVVAAASAGLPPTVKYLDNYLLGMDGE